MSARNFIINNIFKCMKIVKFQKFHFKAVYNKIQKLFKTNLYKSVNLFIIVLMIVLIIKLKKYIPFNFKITMKKLKNIIFSQTNKIKNYII